MDRQTPRSPRLKAQSWPTNSLLRKLLSLLVRLCVLLWPTLSANYIIGNCTPFAEQVRSSIISRAFHLFRHHLSGPKIPAKNSEINPREPRRHWQEKTMPRHNEILETRGVHLRVHLDFLQTRATNLKPLQQSSCLHKKKIPNHKEKSNKPQKEIPQANTKKKSSERLRKSH